MNSDNLYDMVYENLNKWWQKLVVGFIIIDKKGKYKLVNSKMKTFNAQINDTKKKWLKHDADDKIEAILWTAQSRDSLDRLVKKIIKKNTKSNLTKLLKQKKLIDELMNNYKKYFKKYRLFTNKDYTIV